MSVRADAASHLIDAQGDPSRARSIRTDPPSGDRRTCNGAAADSNASLRDSAHPEPARRALAHLAAIQQAGGAWEGEVVWNSMLLAQYVIVRTLVSLDPRAASGHDGASPLAPFDAITRRKMVAYFAAEQRPDGGFGMHSESRSYVFFTALAYVALRLLGVTAGDPLAARARDYLRAAPGGVLSIPTWGKFWLSMLGLYRYEGVNPILPELFLLPDSVPLHPNRYYCHTRYIYLAIAYLYGLHFRADLGPITAELRNELFDLPFETIDFAAHRHDLAPSDLYVRPGLTLRLAYDMVARYERVHSEALRRRALEHCFLRILYEMRSTRYQGLSPVNGLLSCLAIYATDNRHPDLEPSLRGLDAWRWEDDRTIRYAGARSHAWDTAFALRSALDAPPDLRSPPVILAAYRFLRETQIKQELAGRAAERRDSILGGFCFSDGAHRWPVSDCTAEALSAILLVHDDPSLAPRGTERIPDERLIEAGRFILARQNDDGGFGTYERRRGGLLLETLNPSEMFGDCMTERSYIECTASCIGALARLRSAPAESGGKLLVGSEMARVERALSRAVDFLRKAQEPDGSYRAFWGVGFTYAIFHVVEAFCAAGFGSPDPVVDRATRWLLSKQRADGGWGEHHASCRDGRYAEHPESQAANTAWALLALLAAGHDPSSPPVMRALHWLISRQRSDGSWPAQSPAGVFFGTAVLDYRLYKDYFPAWALARHASHASRR